MGGGTLKYDTISRNHLPDRAPGNDVSEAVKQALLFILPALVITASSIYLFTLLTGFTMQELNAFAVTIFLALMLSLLGTALLQVPIYRILDENRESLVYGARRAVAIGLLIGMVYSACAAAIVYYVLLDFLQFSPETFLNFTVLLLLFTMTWAITTVFWAAERFLAPAAITTLAYLMIMAITALLHRLNPAVTILGYIIGVLLLFLLMVIMAVLTFGRIPRGALAKPGTSLLLLVRRNIYFILFQVFYVVAIFLDKVIVWVYQGMLSGGGLIVTGEYTTGAFLGLIPVFGTAATAYFNRRAVSVLRNRYDGTLQDIKRRNAAYIRLYGESVGLVFLLWASLFIILIGFIYTYFGTTLVFNTAATVGVGALFLVLILHNANVLAVFGRERISAISMLLIVVGEAISALFVPLNVWYAAAGFFCGAFTGFVVSQLAVFLLFGNLEYTMYSYVTRSSGVTFK